jgi:hypothetical protein
VIRGTLVGTRRGRESAWTSAPRSRRDDVADHVADHDVADHDYVYGEAV